jgi:GDPmannose 4,6-dehydratase
MIGKGKDEIGINPFDKKVLIEIDEKYFRKNEVKVLRGNSQRAEKELKWNRKTKFEDLVYMMVKSDIDNISQRCKNEKKF